MNIYEFKVSGEQEWFCANTIIEALQFYNDLTDIGIHDFSDTDDIRLVPVEEWESLKIVDIELNDKDGNHPIIETFADYMKTAVKPGILATTCY